jgi:hypothetical protein
MWLEGLYTRPTVICEEIEFVDMALSNPSKIACKATVRAFKHSKTLNIKRL